MKVDLKKRIVRLLIAYFCFRVEPSGGLKADMVLELDVCVTVHHFSTTM